MRVQAIRASETLYKAGDKSFAADYKRLTQDASPDVVIQAMLTMNKWKVPDANATIAATAAANKARGVQLVATAALNPAAANAGRGGRGAGPVYTPEQQGVIDKGGQIYKELCFACHGDDGLGATRPGDTSGVTMAPRLAGSPRVNGHRDYVIKAVLHGLTGPVDGRTYSDVMIPMASNPDEWIASVASYVRTSFGNAGGVVSASDVQRVRAATSSRKQPWTVAGARGDAAESAPARCDLEGDRQPQSGRRERCPEHDLVEQPGAAGARHVVPDRAAAADDDRGIQFDSTSGGRGGGGRNAVAAAPPGGAPAAAAPGARAGGPGPAGPAPAPGYPRGYKVETSMNGTAWTPAAEGQGESATTLIAFKPVQARFVRLTQTAALDGAPPWSIQQLRLFEPGKPPAER